MSTAKSNSSHGNGFQNLVNKTLQALIKDGILTHVVKEFRAREPGYENPDQYYAPFLIQFNDRTRWILFTTTSLRTDRIKGQQWDADCLKRVDATISKALLVYPDDADDKVREEFRRQKEKYDSKWEYSRIDDILQLKELIASIMRSDTENLGREWDARGRNFERFIADVLNDRGLFELWKRKKTSAEFKFKCLCKILDCLNLNRDSVMSIKATADKNDIGLLPSGGSPKTDVVATVELADNARQIFTFSCKRSTYKHVSAHQYSADSFADTLDKTDRHLRALLQTFQLYGNYRDFPHEDCVALQKILAGKMQALCKWVVGGHGGGGSGIQLANYVITYRTDKNSLSVHSTNEYVRKLLNVTNGFMGTPFQWTYASGQQGKSIQLKMPLL